MVYSTKVYISATWTMLDISICISTQTHYSRIQIYINIAAMCLVCGHLDWVGIYRWARIKHYTFGKWGFTKR